MLAPFRLFYDVRYHTDKHPCLETFLSKYLYIVSMQALGEKNPQEPKVSLDPKKMIFIDIEVWLYVQCTNSFPIMKFTKYIYCHDHFGEHGNLCVSLGKSFIDSKV